VVERLKEEYDVDIQWRPFDLHPETPREGAPLPDYIRARHDSTFDRLRERALASGREMVPRAFIASSRRALEAAEYARAQGRFQAFHEAVFGKYFGEGRNIGGWDVLREAAEEAGVDPDAMQQAVEEGVYGAEVDESTSRAVAMGITGVPTYILDDKYAVVGAHPYSVFETAMRRLEEERLAADTELPPD
jgi:predicted DsbA family dithiol-disulfide isomerase